MSGGGRAELCRAGSVLRARGSPWRAFAREAMAKASPERGWSILGIRLELPSRTPLPPRWCQEGIGGGQGLLSEHWCALSAPATRGMGTDERKSQRGSLVLAPWEPSPRQVPLSSALQDRSVLAGVC